MSTYLLVLPVKPGVNAASFLARFCASKLESNFRGLKCTRKIDALPLISGGPVEEEQIQHCQGVKKEDNKLTVLTLTLHVNMSYSLFSTHRRHLGRLCSLDYVKSGKGIIMEEVKVVSGRESHYITTKSYNLFIKQVQSCDSYFLPWSSLYTVSSFFKERTVFMRAHSHQVSDTDTSRQRLKRGISKSLFLHWQLGVKRTKHQTCWCNKLKGKTKH